MADFGIYDDLDLLEAREKEKANEDRQWKEKYQIALGTIEKLQVEKKELNKKIKQLETNFTSLFETARAEIKRKDIQIAELRKERDDICFRRNVRPAKKYLNNGGPLEDVRRERAQHNPFAHEAKNVLPTNTKKEDKTIDKPRASYPNDREEEYNRRSSRTHNRQHVPRGISNHDRSRSRNRSEHLHHRDRSSTKSSDSSREKTNRYQNRHSRRLEQENRGYSNGITSKFASSKQGSHSDFKFESDKERTKDELRKCKTKEDKSEDGQAIRESSIENKENRGNDKIATLEKEILKDVKEFKKNRESEKDPKPEEDAFKVATEKANEFLEALFDDMVMSNVNESNAEVLPPNGTCNVKCITDVNENKTEVVTMKASENHNERGLRTPVKRSVANLYDDLFGPSPVGCSGSTAIERKNCSSSVRELSFDSVEFIPIVSESKTADSLGNQNDSENPKNNAGDSSSRIYFEEKPQPPKEDEGNVERENGSLKPAKLKKILKVAELDGSFFSSEEEENEKESPKDSQSDIESPSFENCCVSNEAINNNENLIKSVESESASEKCKNDLTMENISEESENDFENDERHNQKGIHNGSFDTAVFENLGDKNVKTLTVKENTSDREKDQSHKLLHREKHESETLRHSSEKNEKKDEIVRKDFRKHHHSSKHSSSEKDSWGSENSKRKSEIHRHKKSKKYATPESEKHSSLHGSLQFSSKHSKDRRHHSDRFREKISLVEQKDGYNTTSVLHKEDASSSIKHLSLREENSSDLKKHQDQAETLRCSEMKELSTKDKEETIDKCQNMLDFETKSSVEEMETSETENLLNNTDDCKVADCVLQSTNEEKLTINKSEYDNQLIKTTNYETELSKECTNILVSSEQPYSTNDEKFSTDNEVELVTECVSTLTGNDEETKINEKMDSDCVLFGADVKELSTPTTDNITTDKVAANNEGEQSSNSTNSTNDGEESNSFPIHERFAFNEKSCDDVSLSINVDESSKSINGEQIESNAKVETSSDCIPPAFDSIIAFETANNDIAELSCKSEQTNLESSKSVTNSLEGSHPTSESLSQVNDKQVMEPSSNLTDKEAPEPQQVLDSTQNLSGSTDVTVAQTTVHTKESNSSGRRKKIKTPRKYTHEKEALSDFSVAVMSLVSNRCTKSDNECSSSSSKLEQTQSLHKRLTKSASNLEFIGIQAQISTQSVGEHTHQQVVSGEVKKLMSLSVGKKDIKVPTSEISEIFDSEIPVTDIEVLTSEISATGLSEKSHSVGEEIEQQEMPALWVDEESTEDLLITITTKGSKNLDNAEKQDKVESDVTSASKKRRHKLLQESPSSYKAVDKKMHHKKRILNTSTALCIQESISTDDCHHHHGKNTTATVSTNESNKKLKKKALDDTKDNQNSMTNQSFSDIKDPIEPGCLVTSKRERKESDRKQETHSGFPDFCTSASIVSRTTESFPICNAKQKYKKQILQNFMNSNNTLDNLSDTSNQPKEKDLQSSFVSGSNGFALPEMLATTYKKEKLSRAVPHNSLDCDIEAAAGTNRNDKNKEYKKFLSKENVSSLTLQNSLNFHTEDDNKNEHEQLSRKLPDFNTEDSLVLGYQEAAISCDKKYKKRVIEMATGHNNTGNEVVAAKGNKTKCKQQNRQHRNGSEAKDAVPVVASNIKEKSDEDTPQHLNIAEANSLATDAVVDSKYRHKKKRIQDFTTNESKKNHKKKILQDYTDSKVKYSSVIATSDSKVQHNDMLQGFIASDTNYCQTPCAKGSFDEDVAKVLSVSTTTSVVKEAVYHRDKTTTKPDSTNLFLTINNHNPLESKELLADGPISSCHKGDIKSAGKNNPQKIGLQTTSSTNFMDESCSKESFPYDNKEQNAIHIKRKVKPIKQLKEKRKRRRITSSSSDVDNVPDVEVPAQSKKLKKLEDHPDLLANDYAKSSSISTTSDKSDQTIETSGRSPPGEKTPTHHKIFHTDVLPKDQQATLPSPYPENEDDVQYREIDNRLRSMFQSPNTSVSGSIESANVSSVKSIEDENLTVEETLNGNEKSQCDTSTSSRKISVGSNDYVIETIGAHTANVFITRKKSKKRMKILVATG